MNNILRVYYSVKGTHVHADVFSGREGYTFAMLGKLVFTVEEWEKYKGIFQKEFDDFKIELIQRRV
jgi:hypothetical protein